MKVFIVAVLIFSFMFAGVFLNVGYLTDTLGKFKADLAAIPCPAEEQSDLTLQSERLNTLRKRWNVQCDYISLTVNHADLMEVETQFAAAIGAANAGTRENYLVSVSQLDYALSHLIEMAQASAKNII